MTTERIPIERIETKILLLRGQKVMLDRDLAALYGVATGNLKRAVLRNAERFPDDFMFVLDSQEVTNLTCQIGISSSATWGGLRHAPMAFRAGGGNAVERAEQSARHPGEYRHHARLHTAATHPRLARGLGAQAGRVGEEVRRPVPRGVRCAAPVDEPAGAIPSADRV